MSTYAYKGFDLIDPSEAAASEDWGSQEATNWQRAIDYIGTDCIDDDYDSLGHKHAKFYNPDGDIVIDANNDDGLLSIGNSATSIDVDLNDGDASALDIKTASANVLHYDSLTSIITLGGDGNSLYIGESLGETTFFVNSNVAAPFKIDVGTRSSSANVMTISTTLASEKTTLKAFTATYPLTLENDSDVYTRDRFAVNHTTVGFSSLEFDSVTAKMIGSDVELTIDIQGVSNTGDFYIEVPFALEEGENATSGERGTLGHVDIENDSSHALGRIWFLAGNGSTTENRLQVGQLTTTIPSFDNYGTKGVYGKIRFRVADPEFTNTAP